MLLVEMKKKTGNRSWKYEKNWNDNAFNWKKVFEQTLTPEANVNALNFGILFDWLKAKSSGMLISPIFSVLQILLHL